MTTKNLGYLFLVSNLVSKTVLTNHWLQNSRNNIFQNFCYAFLADDLSVNIFNRHAILKPA